jgi:type IV pilus assembly protein PilC
MKKGNEKMPFYFWRGMTIDGTECKGKLFALSPKNLDERLFAQGIAVISCTQRQSLFHRSVTQATKVFFFQELSVLLNAAVLLPDALMMLGSQFPQHPLQNIIQTLAVRVTDGIPLYNAMKEFPAFFTPFMIQMIHIGYESGNMHHSVTLLSDHLRVQQRFKNKIRTSLMAPACTCIFFIIITCVIFVFIVPHFASLLHATDKVLPITTQYMLSFSSFLSSLAFPLIMLTGVVTVLILWRRLIVRKNKTFLSGLIVRVPFFGWLVRDQLLAHFFNALHMLLAGGVQLVDALHSVATSMQNTFLGRHLALLEDKVRVGSSLSQALYVSDMCFFDTEIISMIAIAQESGDITSAVGHVGRMYANQVTRKLSIFSTTVQPLILIILGILVSLLVFSIYIPLFSMVETITV